MAFVCLIFTLILGFGVARQVLAEGGKTTYPTMAPLDQCLMPDRNAEIDLMRSAAPESILGTPWMSPFDAPEFWNPKIRGPLCFNPPAARSILPITLKRTEWILAGLSKTQIMELTKKAFDKPDLPALEPGAMSYMMSKTLPTTTTTT